MSHFLNVYRWNRVGRHWGTVLSIARNTCWCHVKGDTAQECVFVVSHHRENMMHVPSKSRCHVCSVVCGLSACQRCSFRSNVIVSVFCSRYICSNASQCRAQHDICTLDIHWICSELVATCPRDQSPTSRMRYASPAMTAIRQRRAEARREMTVLRRELRQDPSLFI